jgi:hypothetical protein
MRNSVLLVLFVTGCTTGPAIPPPPAGLTPPVQTILNAAPAADWRPLDPQNTLYMDFPQGRVIIEMAQAADPERLPMVGQKTLKAKFFIGQDAGGRFTPLPDPDTYATEVGSIGLCNIVVPSRLVK